ncbi:uncharacterized protein CLUP02_17025 [Colletotrichum lupini]|uniref:Uncharacterized protein n=1 Tax=Colletotrichum lupini TaxID=145971 RepID=A0A9Q8WQR0_9PEZI|nr:uncharacterized protein CLUP02_17025 [Colletotrichum lupini]UQC91490.1 hypothetical protein CLUP02_17025 [Colletotrichum lupini]
MDPDSNCRTLDRPDFQGEDARKRDKRAGTQTKTRPEGGGTTPDGLVFPLHLRVPAAGSGFSEVPGDWKVGQGFNLAVDHGVLREKEICIYKYLIQGHFLIAI